MVIATGRGRIVASVPVTFSSRSLSNRGFSAPKQACSVHLIHENSMGPFTPKRALDVVEAVSQRMSILSTSTEAHLYVPSYTII